MEHDARLQAYEKHVYEQGPIDAFMLSMSMCAFISIYTKRRGGHDTTRAAPSRTDQ